MDFDEHIDPLDPRFVDAVLARARARAAAERETAEAPPQAPVAEAPPQAPVAEAPPQAPVAEAPPQAPAAEAPPAAAPSPVAPSPHATARPAEAASTRVDDTAPHEAAPVERAQAVEQAPTSEQAPAPEQAEPVADAELGDLTDEDDDEQEHRRLRGFVEWIAVAVGAVVVAFLIRAFLLQAFYIPSESMEPTLYEDDRILVNKLSYKLHDVNRGDLVVFEKPPNEPDNGIEDLIKRAIALPGETIELRPEGAIVIDGQVLDEPYLADQQQPGQMAMLRENFVEGACTNPVAEATRCTLGEGFVWVMGDNRDHSHDSRAFGPIDDDLIVGRAFVKVWPLSDIGFL